MSALPLGPRLIAIRVLGTNADAPGIDPSVKAGGTLPAAESHADLREATDFVARSAQEMGLDRFKPFLRKADDYLTQSGGLVALLRETTKPPISERVTVGQHSANGRAAVGFSRAFCAAFTAYC